MGVEVSNRPRLVEVMSNNKVCPRCMVFCFERKPIFKPGGAALFFANGGRLPQTKVYCKKCMNRNLPNGDEWGWNDVTDISAKNVHLEYDMRNVRRGR
jgi:hypothetical protein